MTEGNICSYMSLGTFRPKSSKFILEMGKVGKVEEKGNLKSDNLESPLTEG